VRATFEHIEAAPELSWKYFVREAPRFEFAWHFHREYELTLITRGTGTRFVGDSVEEYADGDLTLIGSQLPHTYATQGIGPHRAVVAQFRYDFLGDGFLAQPEFADVAALLDRAARGLSFPAASWPGPYLEPGHRRPAEQTLGLLGVLVELARRGDVRTLASEHYRPSLEQGAADRVDALVQFMIAGYAEPVRLETLARVAHMAPTAVSRFFRRTTGLTITDYLNSLRVNAACQLLRDTDLPITEVAAAAGYQNLSHFNRRFRALKRMAPREYRAQFRRS
jgi:AraC-like DNA-binding protein